jgi:hypothetical protein
MKPKARFGLIAILWAVVVALPALAYEFPFSPEAIREAYFLGKGHAEKKDEFFKPYKHDLAIPKTGPHVGLIEVETPFMGIVNDIASRSLSYHAQETEQDYLGKPGDFRVHVEIYFTPTYPADAANTVTFGAFWNDFKVHMKQRAEIEPRSIHGQPIYDDDTISGYDGAMIDVNYDVTNIDPGALTTIVVETPDGQDVETTFDLSQLR